MFTIKKINKVILFSLFFFVSSCLLVTPSGIKQYTANDLNISNIDNTTEKKKRFFDFMRPIINDENSKVFELRKKLLVAKKHDNNKKMVADTAKDYNVEWQAGKENWAKLLERVDTVALELALAQSANESAWGQSRFAKQGNNFFGQWCYKKGCGIIPENREKGTKHEVARFKSVNDSVRSYIKNINTGRVYAPLRIARKNNRASGKQPNAKIQAGGLAQYSQRREEYVKEVIAMIQVNKKLMLGQ